MIQESLAESHTLRELGEPPSSRNSSAEVILTELTTLPAASTNNCTHHAILQAYVNNRHNINNIRQPGTAPGHYAYLRYTADSSNETAGRPRHSKIAVSDCCTSLLTPLTSLLHGLHFIAEWDVDYKSLSTQR